MDRKGSEWAESAGMGLEWGGMGPERTECAGMGRNGPEWARNGRNRPECAGMGPARPEWTGLEWPRMGSECKDCRNGPEMSSGCGGIARNGPEWTTPALCRY